ncbi:NAD(P)-dependent oxidoreductase [Mycolicibacterium komossense]|uniref:NAD(P)-dependent oxidoreductase n=1 Tax=Mycolicibacterium komossense TaxID=1779 RepID=UPI0021F36A13|nr:NAD(P)-dependent oxidoreductase [Mycolicibacterium komossense]
MTPRSLSTGRHPALERLQQHGFELVFPAPARTPTTQELLTELPTCVAYLAGVEPISGEVLRSAPQLRVIARNGVGVNNIDLVAARELGVEVLPAVGANSQGVAELALALAFAGVRRIPWSDARLKAGDWSRSAGVELSGRTMGIIGVGQVGRRLATMAAGIGMNVIGYDAFPDPRWTPPARFRWSTIDQVLAAADVLSLHAPPGDKPLLDSARLARMPKAALLINTARAELVDEDAVLAALNEDHLTAYAVDAFSTEPPNDLRLVGHEKVIATPHVGGFTQESVGRASESAVDAILSVLQCAPAAAGR